MFDGFLAAVPAEVIVVAGYLWAVPIAAWPIQRVMRLMPEHPDRVREAAEAADVGQPEVWHRTAFGIAERSVVATAAAIRAPEVIAGWLVFKVAMSWGRWPHQPGTFNRFAVGTVLSLAFAVSGGALISSTLNTSTVAGLLAGPILLTAFIWSLYRWERWGGWWGVEAAAVERD
jgi:hypothetical protein